MFFMAIEKDYKCGACGYTGKYNLPNMEAMPKSCNHCGKEGQLERAFAGQSFSVGKKSNSHPQQIKLTNAQIATGIHKGNPFFEIHSDQATIVGCKTCYQEQNKKRDSRAELN